MNKPKLDLDKRWLCVSCRLRYVDQPLTICKLCKEEGRKYGWD